MLETTDNFTNWYRCEYFRTYIEAMAQAVAQDGVNIFGALCWSLLDNFEWSEGYQTRSVKLI